MKTKISTIEQMLIEIYLNENKGVKRAIHTLQKYELFHIIEKNILLVENNQYENKKVLKPFIRSLS